ncbi:MAG: methyltransferase [Candidatus Nanohaloarchaeota archaeon]|nr:methyltransferase [Candidatus Nanohaloarchaeota archaeon]
MTLTSIENYLKEIDKRSPYDSLRTYVYKKRPLEVWKNVWDPYKGKSTKMFLDVFAELSFPSHAIALEIGCGCGILSLELWYAGIRQIFASDVSYHACKNAKCNFEQHNADIYVINADLFPPLKSKFDIVIFNAPAVHPSRTNPFYSNTLWSNDINLLKRFLDELPAYLSEQGHAYVMYARFSDFDPLPFENYSRSFNIDFVKTYKGEHSDGGILKIKLK